MSMANPNSAAAAQESVEEQQASEVLTKSQQSTEEKPSGSSCSFEPTPGPSTSQKHSSVPPVKKSPPPPAAAGGSTNSLDDPKPGPSTTAADFDLEVFDSCSSCSLETDCWGPPGCNNSSCGSSPQGPQAVQDLQEVLAVATTSLVSARGHLAKGHKNKPLRPLTGVAAGPSGGCQAGNSKKIPSDLSSDNSSVEDFNMASPILDLPEPADDAGSQGGVPEEVAVAGGSQAAVLPPGHDLPADADVPASACPSETEEATSERDDLNDDVEDVEDMDQEEDVNVVDVISDADEPVAGHDLRLGAASVAGPVQNYQCDRGTSSAPVPSLPSTTAGAGCSQSSSNHCKLFGLKMHCHSSGPETPGTSGTGVASKISCASGGASGNDNIDQIVQDHDNFGTDENEDSLDSSSLLPSVSSLATPLTASQPQMASIFVALSGGSSASTAQSQQTLEDDLCGAASAPLETSTSEPTASTSSLSSAGGKRKGFSLSPERTYCTSKKKRKDTAAAAAAAAAAAESEASVKGSDSLAECNGGLSSRMGITEGSSRLGGLEMEVQQQEQEVCSIDHGPPQLLPEDDSMPKQLMVSCATASSSATESNHSYRTENDDDEVDDEDDDEVVVEEIVEEEVIAIDIAETASGVLQDNASLGDHHIKLNDITGSVGSSSVGGLCNSHNQTSETTSGEDGPRLVGGTAASCSSSGDTGSGMKLIPDKDNPPQEMLDWVESFSRWSHAQRLLAIDQLIGRCEPVQVRHMMSVIEPQFQRDFISLLPKELALYVLSFLKPRDLLNAAQTCRYWRILAEDNLLWREKCREAGMSEAVCSSGAAAAAKRKKSSNFLYSAWKLGFMREHRIESNWRTRSCVDHQKILKGHDDHVITCLQFSNNRIVSGSDDNTLKVWSASTGRCLRTLVGHTGGVWSSQMEGNVIVSGSTDRTLKVWNADTGACDHTLYGHTSTVRCMHLHKNLVVSGSRDATLRMWDIESGNCLHVLMGHVAAVRCVQFDGRLVVSGAYDYMVKVWNPETEECLHTLSGHTNRVYSLQFDGIHVVSGSLDTSIRVWDVETGACKHALMGHQSLTSGMELKDNILVSGNADSTVKVWDITTGQCLQTLSGPNKHQSAVTCLQFNNKFVVTSSDDGTVKLWDVKTGEFIRDLVSLKSGGSGGVVWRIRANATKLVCAVGSRNGTEETKLMVLDFDASDSTPTCTTR